MYNHPGSCNSVYRVWSSIICMDIYSSIYGPLFIDLWPFIPPTPRHPSGIIIVAVATSLFLILWCSNFFWKGPRILILIDHWLEERGIILRLSTRMKTVMGLAKFSHEIQNAGLIIDQMTCPRVSPTGSNYLNCLLPLEIHIPSSKQDRTHQQPWRLTRRKSDLSGTATR